MKITIARKEELIKGVYAAVEFSAERDFSVLKDQGDRTTLVIGIEGMLPLTLRRLTTLVRMVVQEARATRSTRVALSLDRVRELEGYSFSDSELLRLIAENVHLANYEFNHFKEKPKKGWNALDECILVGLVDLGVQAALKKGELIAKEVNACRDLSNTPGGDMTPTLLATRIRASAKGTGATVQVLSVKDMETLKMGAILGVARGAQEKPCFIIVEYWGRTKKDAPTVLVGKGVTFDTGGLSLKPADYMLDMHLDMSGGAAVAHAVLAAARLKLPLNAIALIPAVENAISGESYRPGDVLRSMSGKSIDILNTDAEGRVILADALTYAKRYKPALVVDVATLTGAALVALGTKASAVLSPDDFLATRLCALGEESGDYCWPLPMWEEYKSMVKGRFGDVANIPTENSRYAGTIGGAMFLAEFALGYPWAHIDIASRMVSDKADRLAQGAAGAPVRLLVRLLEAQAAEHSKKASA